MLKKDPNFQCLKVGGRGLNGSASYWLGPDHLLVVEVVNYVERYRRFYFRDIQAIVIQQNRLQLWINLVLGGFLLFTVMLVASIVPASGNWSDGEAIGAGIVTGIALGLLVGLVRNTLRGRTCSVLVRTAVQTQKLKNLTQWRSAEKLLETLQPLILAAQTSPDTAPPPAATVANPPPESATPSADSAVTP